MRAKPCVCEHCLVENWDQCEIGGWKLKQMAVKGMRNPNEKHLQQQLSEESLTVAAGEWEVVSIHRQRIKAGTVQYLVEWKGFPTCTWVDANKLNADELLEDWELQNEIEVGEGNLRKMMVNSK